MSNRKKTMPAAIAIEIKMTMPVARKSTNSNLSETRWENGRRGHLRRWLKLKLVNEWNRPEIKPGPPDWEVDVM